MKNFKKTSKKAISKKPIKPTKKSSVKKSKKEQIFQEVIQDNDLPIMVTKTAVAWDDSYPYVKETCKIKGSIVELPRYISGADLSRQQEFEKFLFEVVRSNNLPNFIKNNFKKIRKMIEKEISYRLKSAEKLNKEQGEAFKSFFKDPTYFDYSIHGEYFEHEIEKVFTNYLKSYCNTGMYESRVRIGNRNRRELIQKWTNKNG